MRENKQLPTPEEVKEIFKYTYLFYTKWIAVKDIVWDAVLEEAREIEQKYPFDLCARILVGTLDVIDANYMKERDANNG